MRRLALTVYLSAVWALLYLFCITPERALAVQYSRVMARSAQLVVLQANRNAVISAVASTALAPSPASVAIRMVAGPVGWAALGVSVGLALHQTFYNSSDTASLKAGASLGPQHTVPTANGMIGLPLYGSTEPVNPAYPEAFALIQTNNSDCEAKDQGWNGGHDWVAGPFKNVSTFFYQGPTFSGSTGVIIIGSYVIGNAGYYFCHRTGTDGQVGGPVVVPPTQDQVASYINSLPANDPKSVESHTTPNGLAVPVTPADDVTTVPVNADQAGSSVVPNPPPADASVLIQNVPPPSGPQPADTTSQQATTTTTKTTNPDGSTTQQDTTTANVSCIFGQHDGRTMSSVFQSHVSTWQSSGLLALLATFQTLTWPSTLPTLSLQSNIFGTLAVNFNDWSAIFTALRTLIIATTSFLAVRYVFAGGK
ncbi:MAG: hypothetical protein KF793_09670 [Nitrospira sp.]|nr:hypothetical protein [Nitrospira sp.]